MENKSKEKLNKILGKYSMETLKDEKEIFEIIKKISKEPNNDYDEKIIENIDNYLKTKEKMQVANKDIEFLNIIAKSLREQEVRITDDSYPPLFKTTNSIGEEIYFLTREALERYRECNKECSKVIEVPSSNSTELSNLIDIIKRNF